MTSGPLRGRMARAAAITMAMLLASIVLVAPTRAAPGDPQGPSGPGPANGSAAVENFSSALQRLVVLTAAGGSSILALVWARVALSWFSTDVTKKVQAKDRARDALVGTLLFVAAVTGVIGGLAQWVLRGG